MVNNIDTKIVEVNGVENNLGFGWKSAYLTVTLILVVVYGWTVFEPYAGDALMHMMDDTQINSLSDIFRAFYSTNNPAYLEEYRLSVFHRPIFNELYVTFMKSLFGEGSPWLRLTTLFLLVGASWVFISLLRNLGLGVIATFVGVLWLALSPALFFGLYEYGLSFSQLLVFFSIVSIYALQKYLSSHSMRKQIIWGSLCWIFTFFAIFTKESVVVLPFVCVFLFPLLLKTMMDQKNQISYGMFGELKNQIQIITRHHWIVVSLIGITVLYFITRYIKLGSLTGVAAGIEQSPNIIDAATKLVGYTFLSLQVPTAIIPHYMTQSVLNMGNVEMVIRIGLFVVACIVLLYGMRRERFLYLCLLGAILMAFLPIIKVSRNAPYYGDLMMVPAAMAMAIGLHLVKSRVSRFVYTTISVSIVVFLILSSVFFSQRYIYHTDMWLARSQGFVRSALSDMASIRNSSSAIQIVGTSGMYSPEQNWALNHNSGQGYFGSSFVTNLGIPKNKFVSNSSLLAVNESILFLDFIPSIQPRKVGAYPLPGLGRLISAYFPNGVIRQTIGSSIDTSFKVGEYPVLKLTCSNVILETINVEFTKANGEKLKRTLDHDMNLAGAQKISVFEMVAPTQAMVLDIKTQNTTCKTARLEGYKHLEPHNITYSELLSKSPNFKSAEGWQGDFSEVSASDSGVVVGPGPYNRNVLTQKISVNPFDHLKIVATASSVSTLTTLGRLQINWVGLNEEFISSSGKTIEVTSQEKSYETNVVAPAKALYGIIYVTPHTSVDVVRYSEMKLLKGVQQ